MTIDSPNHTFPIVMSPNCLAIEMPQRLTVLEAVEFRDTCHHLLNQTVLPPKIILKFSQTQFMDSSGVGVIVHYYKAAKEKNIELVLLDVQPPVMAVFSMTGLKDALTIISDCPEESSLDYPSCPIPPETHPSVRCKFKRLLDIVGSLVGLGITGVLLIPIVIAIKTDSPGPIFFSQTRCGWLGKQFKIIKFRSMCTDAEALKHTVPNVAKGAIFKNPQDPRITKVGRFLRRTSLDELPQFWNVLMGEMSLVGTRPPTPDEVERYEVPQWQRLNVKPGMTGEWQVYGRSQVKNFEEVIELDLRYQENWSLWYDLQLIFKTILIVFNKNSGAF
ncbi:MAG: anti-sigma factor antagonist [Microcystaceae cyanobacterium]